MKILLTITGYPPSIGGAQIYTHQLALKLIEMGHTVQVATHWDDSRYDWLIGTTLRAPSDDKHYEIDGVPVYRFGLSQSEKARLIPPALGYYLLQGWAINQIASRITKKLHTLGTDWDVVHNVRMGREGISFASRKFAREIGAPFVFEPLHHPRWGGWLYRHYHKLYRTADSLIALTQSERVKLIELGAHPERIHVTGIGPVLSEQANPELFRLQYDLEEGAIVLFLGQHYAYKGIEAMVDAADMVWAVYPDTHFVFVGPPTPFSSLLFDEYPDPRIHKLGMVDDQTKTNALAACDLLCVPSSQESFGGVYVEAWAMGKPVIGGDAPAVQEVITYGVNGFTVDQKPKVIASHIIALLSDPELRQRMAEAGRKKVEENYTWNQLAAKTLKSYPVEKQS